MGRTKSNKAARLALGLHRRIQEARERASITREQMAAWLGLHTTNYARIELGDVAVSAERVAEIARLLHINVASLYGESGPEETNDDDRAA
jgi:DNA-binding XRE family transcriptional regulator